MKYVATKKGFYDDKIVQVGEVFEAEDFEGKWAVKQGSERPVVEKSEAQLVQEAKEGLQGKRKKKTKKKASKKKD